LAIGSKLLQNAIKQTNKKYKIVSLHRMISCLHVCISYFLLLTDSKALIKSSAQKLEVLRKENSEMFEQLGNKEQEVKKLRDNVDGLVKENERLAEADQDHLQAQRDLLGEIEMLQSQVDQSTSDCTNTKQSLDKCLKEGEELKQQKIDIESNKYNSDMEFSAVQKQCQTDTDNLRSQYQFEIDNIGKQYQSDLDRIRKQYQSDLDQIKNDYQSNLDSLTMHITAKNRYTQSQNTEDGKCDKNGNDCTEFEENVGSDGSHGDESYTTNAQSGQQRQSNQRYVYYLT
jgi:chromosome segregation ATPase